MNLLIGAAAGCFTLMGIFHLVIRWRVRRLFNEIREQAPHVWERIGSPPTLSVAVKDPKERWKLLMRRQEFLNPEDSALAHRIVTVRRRIIVASYLAGIGALGSIVFIALWF
jgi:hypothetical protein